MTRLHSNGALGLLDSLTYYELNWRGWLAGSLALVGTKSNRLARYICLVLSFEMDHYMSLVLSHVMVSYLTLVPSLTRARLCHLGTRVLGLASTRLVHGTRSGLHPFRD
jgi:hypothetical protein